MTSRVIVFSENGDYDEPGFEITEKLSTTPLQPEELVGGAPGPQHNPTIPQYDGTDTPEDMSCPETGPLTADMILTTYDQFVSYRTSDALLDTIVGGPEYTRALELAKSEIASGYLWRMGLPNELNKFVDLDDAETREFFQDEYNKIPEDTIRDNSPNSFRNRWERLMAHFADKGVPEQAIQDTIEIWRDDLQIRCNITGGSAGEQSPNEAEPLDPLK